MMTSLKETFLALVILLAGCATIGCSATPSDDSADGDVHKMVTALTADMDQSQLFAAADNWDPGVLWNENPLFSQRLTHSCKYFERNRDGFRTEELSRVDWFVLVNLFRSLPIRQHLDWLTILNGRVLTGEADVDILERAAFPIPYMRRDIYEAYADERVVETYGQIEQTAQTGAAEHPGASRRVYEELRNAVRSFLDGTTIAGIRRYEAAYGPPTQDESLVADTACSID